MRKLVFLLLVGALLLSAFLLVFLKRKLKMGVLSCTSSLPCLGRAAMGPMQKTIEKFNQKWPNVKINYEAVADYSTNVKLAFSNGDGPDIVYVADIDQQMLQKNNLLMDITEDVIQRKWLNKQFPGSIEFNNLRTPRMFYSVPFIAAPVAVFYNKDIFAKLQLQPPQTLDQFNTICQKVKDAGYIPLENGRLSNFNLLWMIFHIVMSKAPLQDVQDWYYGHKTSDKVKEAFIYAFKQTDSWVKNDYFRKDFSSIDYGNTIILYGQGKTAMTVDGDWDLDDIVKTKVPTGVFLFPQAQPSKERYIVNATDGAWALNAKLNPEKKQAALNFIGIFMDTDVITRWYEIGLTPTVKFDNSKSKALPLKQEFNKAVAGSHMGFFLDNCFPGFTDVLTKKTQELTMGAVTPEQCWEELNKEYEKLKSDQTSK